MTDQRDTTGEPAQDQDFEGAAAWVSRALDDVIKLAAGEHCRVDVAARVRATLAQWRTDQYCRSMQMRNNQRALREVAAQLTDDGERPVIARIVDEKIRALEDVAIKALRDVELLTLAATLVFGVSYQSDARRKP